MVKKHVTIAESVQQYGVESYPNEACGVVVRKGRKYQVIRCANVSETPRTNFVMSIQDYSDAADTGDVVGIWHTHIELSSKPSSADLAGCEDSELPWYIIGIRKSEDGYKFEDMEIVEPSGFELPYLERPYVFGVVDCFSLLRDFYKREYGIDVKNGPRVEQFWKKGVNYLGEGWNERGFVRVFDTPAIGDVFLIQTTNDGMPNHIAIYLGNDVIMHHCHGRLSRRDIYGGYWQKHTTHHLRHKERM